MNGHMTGCLDWENGMSSSAMNSNRDCGICDAPSNGYHFNAPSCSACAAFFRRTVTLNRNFVCSQQGQCRVNFAMRVICRSCRYIKCLRIGMDRSQVQPRRDCNAGRRKIMYQQDMKHNPVASVAPYQPLPHPNPPPSTIPHNLSHQNIQPNELVLPVQEENNFFHYQAPTFHSLNDIPPLNQDRQSPEEVHYAQSYSSSISEDVPSPKFSFHSLPSKDFAAEQVLEDLLREERLYNERKKLLYCSHSSITKLLSCDNPNDIPYTDTDLRPLTFSGIKKQIRPQILVIYEWLRGWRHFDMLNTYDRNVFLRRSVLYHTLLDPCFLTYRLGLPDKYIMFNGMYVGIDDDDKTGWETEDNLITAELKIDLYRPLMKRSINEICSSMQALNMTFVEYVIVKALVIFKCTAFSEISLPLKKLLNNHMDLILKALNVHYHSIGLPREEIAQRTGNVVLMMSGIFAVGMECLESHQKIQFFDLWQLDDLLMKLISRTGSREL